MRLAFYAPLKSPDHPVPSGDRTMARSLISALNGLGARVTLASQFGSRDGVGDTTTQAALVAQAEALLPEIVDAGRAAGWHAWITYHNYYKAPDLLGPIAARALGIPYVQIESTRARKRLNGPWADFAKRAEAASDAADVILYLTHRDAEALMRDAPDGQHLCHLRPFLNTNTLPPQAICEGPMLTVGMMREGDKLASYKIIADTLALLPDRNWHLNIAGDGPAMCHVATLMAPFGDAVGFLGALGPTELARTYQNSSLFFWPGVNEAFGMTYLEAQAAGLPVVAQNRPGVCDVLAAERYPSPQEGPSALATVLTRYLTDRPHRRAAGDAARVHIAAHHLLPAAIQTLRKALALAGIPT